MVDIVWRFVRYLLNKLNLNGYNNDLKRSKKSIKIHNLCGVCFEKKMKKRKICLIDIDFDGRLI